MKKILIILALISTAQAQPFFNKGGFAVVDNGVESISGAVGLGGTLIRPTEINVNSNSISLVGLPNNSTASRLMVQDGSGGIGWMDKTSLQTPYQGTIVYVNSIDPNTATIFDTINPPTINRPSFVAQQRTLYLASDNSTWVHNGLIYVTTASIDKTPFYLSGTTSDAGGNKNSSIYRYGRLGIGLDNPGFLLDVRTNLSDTDATIGISNTSTSSTSQARMIMRSYNHAAQLSVGNSNVAYGYGNGLTIGPLSPDEDIVFRVGNALSGTASTYPMMIQNDGNVGIGVNFATNALHINSANDPLRLVGLTSGSSQDSVLTVNASGVVFRQHKSRIIDNTWRLDGNQNTLGKFIGTTDANAFTIKANNVQKAKFNTNNTIELGDATQMLNFVDINSLGGSIVRTTSNDGNSQNGLTATIGSRSASFWGTGSTFNGYSGVTNSALLLANGQPLQLQQFGGTLGEQEIRFNIGNGARRMTLTTTGLGIGTPTPTARLEVSSGVANTSGLKFTNFTSSTPTATGQPIGVDASGNIVTVSAGAAGWGLNGNAGTVAGTNYIGTSDNIPVEFRVGNVFSGTLSNVTNANTIYGVGALTTGTQSVYIGNGTGNTGASNQNVCVGINARSSGGASGATLIGFNAGANLAWGPDVIAIGRNAGSGSLSPNTTNNVILIGRQARTTAAASNGIAIGDAATVGAILAVAVGSSSSSSGQSASAFGNSARAVATNATAIGANAQATTANTMVLGSINGVNGATSDVNVGIRTQTPTSNLHVNGSQAVAVRTVTASTTATDTDYVLIATTGTPTITLPAANTCSGRVYEIARGGATSITVSPAFIVTTGVTSTSVGSYAKLISNGTNWYQIGQ